MVWPILQIHRTLRQNHTRLVTEYARWMVYDYWPYWSAGAVPSSLVSLWRTTNIGILVPSLLGYQTYKTFSVFMCHKTPMRSVYLISDEIIRVQSRDQRRSVHAPPLLFIPFSKVVASNNSGVSKSSERSKEPRVFSSTIDVSGANEVRCDSLQAFTCSERVEINFIFDLY